MEPDEYFRENFEAVTFNPHAATIRDNEIYNLKISLDYDDDPAVTYPVFLFTPYMPNPKEHYHISLTAEEAIRLRDWLNEHVK